MDFSASAALTLALYCVKTLARTMTKPGEEKPLLLELADSLIASVAGNRADAKAANWLARMKHHWLRLDVDPNHDLLRAVTLSSRLASFRIAVEYAESAGLRSLHWSDRLPLTTGLRSWLRRPCATHILLIQDADRLWLENFLPQMLAELDATASVKWTPPDPTSELSRLTSKLESLVQPDDDPESLLARHLRQEAFDEICRRWPGPPTGFIQAFHQRWFDLLKSAFQAKLKDDQSVANIFFAGQLAALRSMPRGQALPDSALAELRQWFLDDFSDHLLEKMAQRFPHLATPPPAPPAEEPLPPLIEGELPPPTRLPRHSVPYRSLDQRFIGRIHELWQLHRHLARGPAVISGPGGIGKTQLAIEYAHRFSRLYPGGIFWVEAERGPAEIVRQIQPFLGTSFDPTLDPAIQLRLLWRNLAAAPTLVILNNFPESGALTPHLPAEREIAILVTTRRRRLVPQGELTLHPFSKSESLALLNSQHRTHTMAEAEPLIDALGGLPLALELARGSLDNQPSLSIAALIDQLDSPQGAQGWTAFATKYGDDLPTGHEKNIFATFRLSWDNIQSDHARDVLQAMSLLAPEPVPLSILYRIRWFSGDEGRQDLHLAIDELVNLSLVDRVTATGGVEAVSAHRLILAFVKESAPPEYSFFEQLAEGIAAEMSLIHDYAAVAGNLNLLRPVTPHAALLCNSDRTIAAIKFPLARSLAKYEEQAGHYGESVYWASMTLDLAQRLFRQEPARIADARYALAWAKMHLGEYRDAESLARQVLQYRQKSAAPGDIGTANAQYLLAVIMNFLGQYAEAKRLLEQTLQSEQAAYPEGHPDIATTQHELGRVLSNLGQYAEAKRLLEQALKSDQAAYPEGHPSIATTQQVLGGVLSNLGQYAEAKRLLEQSLKSKQAAYPEGHPDIATTRHELGRVLSTLGQYSEAKRLLERALQSKQVAYPEGHPDIAATQHELAGVLSNLGQYAEAKRLLEQVLQSEQTAYPEGHPSIAATQHELARVLSNLGQYAEAKRLLEQALQSDQATFPEGHPDIATTQQVLGGVLSNLGQYAEAKRLLEQALQSKQVAYPEGHPYPAISRSALARILLYLGEPAQARAHLEVAEPALIAAYPPDAAQILLLHGRQAIVQILLGDTAQGWPKLRDAISCLTAQFGPEHHHTRELTNDMTQLLGPGEQAARSSSSH